MFVWAVNSRKTDRCLNVNDNPTPGGRMRAWRIKVDYFKAYVSRVVCRVPRVTCRVSRIMPRACVLRLQYKVKATRFYCTCNCSTHWPVHVQCSRLLLWFNTNGQSTLTSYCTNLTWTATESKNLEEIKKFNLDWEQKYRGSLVKRNYVKFTVCS